MVSCLTFWFFCFPTFEFNNLPDVDTDVVAGHQNVQVTFERHPDFILFFFINIFWTDVYKEMTIDLFFRAILT